MDGYTSFLILSLSPFLVHARENFGKINNGVLRVLYE